MNMRCFHYLTETHSWVLICEEENRECMCVCRKNRCLFYVFFFRFAVCNAIYRKFNQLPLSFYIHTHFLSLCNFNFDESRLWATWSRKKCGYEMPDTFYNIENLIIKYALDIKNKFIFLFLLALSVCTVNEMPHCVPLLLHICEYNTMNEWEINYSFHFITTTKGTNQ